MLVRFDDDEEFVKVVDFGICKARNADRITADATIVGTPQFMAPEQAQGRREEIDHRTDEFALASMAYNLVSGQEPFRGETAVTVLYQVVHQDAEPLSRSVPWPCERVDAVLRRGMAKDRRDRYPGVVEFARALERAVGEDLGPMVPDSAFAPAVDLSFEESRATATPKPSALITVPLPMPRRRRRLAMALAGAMAACAALYAIDRLGWYVVGDAFGLVYRHAVGAPLARFRAPVGTAPDTGAAAEVRRGVASVRGTDDR